jgi:uncharacterized membrane protein YfcA
VLDPSDTSVEPVMHVMDAAPALLGDPLYGLVALVIAGLLAGVINSMAGGGSFLTLPLLMALGLPAGVANGTMRVAIIPQNLSSLTTFHRRQVKPYKLGLKLIGPMAAGALAGSYLATQISDDLFRPIVGVVFVAWAIVLLIKPKRFLEPSGGERGPRALTYLLAGAIGLYGGFLQAGVGFPLIALMVGHLGRDAVRGNAVKVMVVLIYTCLVVPVFALADQIAWQEAIALALGTTTGAWIGTRWQLRSGAKVVRWFVLIMVAISGGVLIYTSVFG